MLVNGEGPLQTDGAGVFSPGRLTVLVLGRGARWITPVAS